MKRSLPLAVWLSLTIIVFAGLTTIFSLTRGYAQRYQEVIANASVDLQRETARLVRLAERALTLEPQLLFDDITQQGTDLRVALAAAVGANERILFATDFRLQGKSLASAPLFYDALQYQKAMSNNMDNVLLQGDLLISYMSFALPPSPGELRSLHRGLIVIAYDLSQDVSKVLTGFFSDRMPDMLVAFLVAMLALWLLGRNVVAPIRELEAATRGIASGHFVQISNIRGSTEIHNLTDSFNQMVAILKQQIASINEQVIHTERIINNVIDGIITVDVNGMVRSFNKSAQQIFGYAAEEVIDRNIKMLIPSRFRAAHEFSQHQFKQATRSKVLGKGREIPGLRKSGEIITLDVGISEIERNNEKIFIAIIRDVSEKTKVEKMKREFVSTVSHELRTPLTAIHGSISLVESGALKDAPAKVQELLANAKRNSSRLLELINDLLDMDKIAEGKLIIQRELCRVGELIDGAVEDNQNYAKQYNVTLRITGDEQEQWIEVDRLRFSQVLSNFLSNACKFSYAGGVVDIGYSLKAPDSVRIFVKDYGEGIPDEFKPLIFGKFRQADSSDTRRKGGTGLGLAISKALVSAMDGDIGFESIQSKGSLFYVDLRRVAVSPLKEAGDHQF